MIGLDTWFFFQLKDKNPESVDFWKSLIRGNNSAMVSLIVLYELGILTRQETGFYDEVRRIITGTKNITLVDIDLGTVEEAIKIKRSHGSPTLDTLIVASYRANNCNEIITADKDIKQLAKKGFIRIKTLK